MAAVTARIGGIAIAGATAIVILAIAMLPFLNPVWVRFEQDRTAVPALTGFDDPTLDRVTGALLGDLAPWGGDFDVAVAGRPLLDDRERGHMRDVRGVFGGFFILALASAALLAASLRSSRDVRSRAAHWRAVRGGARGLAIGLVVAGAFALLAFDALFELFHRLFFGAGTYAFDPLTERLVQLFPVQFWSETAIAVGVVALVMAVGLSVVAGRRLGGADPVAHLSPSRARS